MNQVSPSWALILLILVLCIHFSCITCEGSHIRVSHRFKDNVFDGDHYHAFRCAKSVE